METLHERIGEHRIRIDMDAQFLKFFQTAFPSIPYSPDFKPDMRLVIEGGYGEPFDGYHVEVSKANGCILFRRTDYRIETDSEYKVSRILAYDELALKHALLNLYSSYIIYHNWGLLIHSSCVIDIAKAHLFAGPSGAGKSTAAKLSLPRRILSDEASIVKIKEEGAKVYHSPFRSELYTEAEHEPVWLAGIQLLKQSSRHMRTALAKSDAYLLLIDKIFHWSHDSDETGNALRLLQRLVEAVPVYELQFQKNDAFWELIS